MYRLRPIITAILILAIIASSTIVIATNINLDNKAVELPYGYHSVLRYDEKTGYEELFEEQEIRVLWFYTL